MHAIRTFLSYHKIQSVVVRICGTCNIIFFIKDALVPLFSFFFIQVARRPSVSLHIVYAPWCVTLLSVITRAHVWRACGKMSSGWVLSSSCSAPASYQLRHVCLISATRQNASKLKLRWSEGARYIIAWQINRPVAIGGMIGFLSFRNRWPIFVR